MSVEILMPELGESVHEGTVSRWLKQEGDFVKEDEPVVEIMTDKVNTELGAPASGVLVKILIQEGNPVEVFHAMGLIEEAKSAEEASKKGIKAGTDNKAKAEPTKKPVVSAEQETTSPISQSLDTGQRSEGRRWYTPLVRNIARQHSVSESELVGIKGSGQGGRVTKKDLEAYIASGRSGTAQMPSIQTREEIKPTIAGPEQELVPLSGMRKMIAEAMVRSSQIPTVSTLTEIDVTNMVRFRELNKDAFLAQYEVKLTYTPFFIKAITEAVGEFPLLNAQLTPDHQILKNRSVHVGVAVSLGSKGDEGLIVPVLRDADKKSLIEIAKELELIASKARGNQLQVADVQGATITLTNPGSYGAILGTPMINMPQAAILGAYAIKKMPVIVEDMIAVRSIMNLVLTYDHRLIDGLLAGRFLQTIKAKLEKFEFFK